MIATCLTPMVATLCLLAATLGPGAQAATKFASDEVAVAAKDPAIVDAMAAREKLDQAFARQDVEAVSALFSRELVVNPPSNRVAHLAEVLGLFRAGRMNYEEADTTIEALESRGDDTAVE